MSEEFEPPLRDWGAQDVARAIVNRLYELAELSVLKRQLLNDEADKIVVDMLEQWDSADPTEEVSLDGWKVFVTDGPLGKRMECVTDEHPIHRMTFDFGPDDAREIAEDLSRG